MLGRDEDDAVSTLRAVDSRGRGVLQHREVLDVLNVDIVDVLTLEAVDQDVSLRAGTEGRDTTDPELRRVLTRLTTGLEGHDARHVTGQRVCQVRRAVVLQVVHLDVAHSTRHGELLLCAHTGDDHFVNGILDVFLQLDVDDSLVALDEHLLRLVADVGEDERAVLLHLNLIVTVVVGNGAKALGVLHDDGAADDGLARCVGDASGDVDLVLRHGRQCRTQHKQ